jgi:hypothetical protein
MTTMKTMILLSSTEWTTSPQAPKVQAEGFPTILSANSSQAQNRLIQKLQAQLLQAKDALDDSANNNAELQALLQATVTSMGSDRATVETPGPHRLQPRAPRPEDIEFRDKL